MLNFRFIFLYFSPIPRIIVNISVLLTDFIDAFPMSGIFGNIFYSQKMSQMNTIFLEFLYNKFMIN